MSTRTYKPAEDYENLLRQFNTMSMLINSLKSQRKLQNEHIEQMACDLALISKTEIESQRQANEVLTNEVERLAALQEWQPMATAPMDTMVLLNIEGIVAQGIYSKVDEEWKYVNLQIGLYNGKWEDVYFENESTEIPNGWMPMPAAPAPEALK